MVDMPGEKTTQIAQREILDGLVQFTIPEKEEKKK
jgi:DNA-directed RNA polymerase subunit K/omega